MELRIHTDLHELRPGVMPAALNTCAEETQIVSEERSQSDSERSELPARAREGFEERRHGEASTDFTDSHGLGDGVSTNLHESTQISIRDNPCQFVDENSTGGKPTAFNTENEEERRHGEGNEVLDRIDKIDRIEGEGTDLSNPVNHVNPVKETPCLTNSVTSLFSDSNLRQCPDKYRK